MNDINRHLSTPMGIHRVLKEPFDDREIFESMSDLREYCKNGAVYNGQHVSCIIGPSNDGICSDTAYIQDFTIINKLPIIKFSNSELIIKDIGDGTLGILVYYYNPIGDAEPKIMYDDTKSHNNYLNDIYKFSILELLDAFRINTNTISFRLEVTIISTKNTVIKEWSQDFNPMTDTPSDDGHRILYTPDGEYGMYQCLIKDDNGSGSYTSYYLIPKKDTNSIISLYITGCPEYIKNMIGG